MRVSWTGNYCLSVYHKSQSMEREIPQKREKVRAVRRLTMPIGPAQEGTAVQTILRRELGHALQLRYTPELQFIADDSIAYGAHILEVLRDPEKVKPVNPDNDAVLPEEE